MHLITKHPFNSHRIRTLLAGLIVLTLVIGLGIYPLERRFSDLTTFTTYEDGLWWAITTITSVGYGDYYPVTTPGRILGAILEVAGVMTFGIIVAMVTVNLMRAEQIFFWKRTVERFDRLEAILKNLEKKQSFNIKK